MGLLLWVRMPTLLLCWWRRILGQLKRQDSLSRESILVIRLDALGDLVLTTPVFRELKRSFPQAQITVVAQAAYASILTTNPNIDELLLLRPVLGRLLPRTLGNLLGVLRLYRRELRGRRFDLAIFPRWDTDEHHATLLCLLTNALLRVGYTERTSEGKRRYNRSFDQAYDICLDPGPLQHEVLRNLAVVKAVAGTVRDTQPEIHLTPEDREFARRVLAGAPAKTLRMALGIGAQVPGRRWHLQRYALVINTLARAYRLQVMITCAPAEHAQAQQFAELIEVPYVISDSAEIRETCALLEQCAVYLGNDTGAAHLAASMRCATIVVSRHPGSGDPSHPNSPSRFAPYCAAARVVQPEHGRDDCRERCLHIGPHCIEQIFPSDVIAAVEEAIRAEALASRLECVAR
jgi:heptosyltransferase-2